MSPYVRTVKTSSGATAAQIVYLLHRGSREIEHLGSAHSDAEVELLKAAARQKLAAGQGELDLSLQPLRLAAAGRCRLDQSRANARRLHDTPESLSSPLTAIAESFHWRPIEG